MRILVLYAHPVETSFGAAIHAKLLATLKARGHEVDDCDLNAEGFDPVMSRQERLDYHSPQLNRAHIGAYADRVLAAEAICFSFPVWNMGFPAILKGFVDKVFVPGVSFYLKANGDYVPSLTNVKRVGVACTYGGTRWNTFLAGDPIRRYIKRSFLFNCAPGSRCDYVACHDMNHTTPEKRAAFLAKVEREFSRW